MKRFIPFLIFVALPALASDLSVTESEAARWYRDSYAPLWKVAETIDLERVRRHYAIGYRIHSENGGFSLAKNSNEEWRKTLEYFGGAWIGSDLKQVSVTAFNDNAVSIHSEWLNRNSDGTTSANCANYVAARIPDVGWQFLDLFVLACPK